MLIFQTLELHNVCASLRLLKSLSLTTDEAIWNPKVSSCEFLCFRILKRSCSCRQSSLIPLIRKVPLHINLSPTLNICTTSPTQNRQRVGGINLINNFVVYDSFFVKKQTNKQKATPDYPKRPCISSYSK